jgi:leucyl-tRNA synthetase
MILGEMEYTAYRDQADQWVSAREVKDVERDGVLVKVRKSDGADVSAVSLEDSSVTKKGGDFVLSDDQKVIIDARAHKMSKSRGNVVNPDEIIEQFGADAMRLYEMFMGPLEAAKPWSTSSIQGVARFLDKVWNTCTAELTDDEAADELLRTTHRTIKKVGEDIESMRFNTAISAMMTYVNDLAKARPVPRRCAETLVQLVHPFAPHIAEELWQRLGHQESVQLAPWPDFDEALTTQNELEIPVQVNGKKRGTVRVAPGTDEATLLELARGEESVARHLEGKELARVIWVQDRILTLVVKG